MTLCDLKNDNYYQLVTVDVPMFDFDAKPKLKVYKGTNLISEQHLPGIPSAVESLYINDQEPRIPSKYCTGDDLPGCVTFSSFCSLSKLLQLPWSHRYCSIGT